MKLKICGMKYPENIEQVAALQPDYLGFIFYEKSERCFEGDIIDIANTIKKVGVFVNADIKEVIENIKNYNLKVVQLHGDESPEYCLKLKSKDLEIIKVFSIKDSFNFKILEAYEDVCDYFLFDTKGKLPGGNGYAFNWSVLQNYPSTKPYFLSGGIGHDDIETIKAFFNKEESKYCYAIDVNSKFEIEPGLKHIELLKDFKDTVITKEERLK